MLAAADRKDPAAAGAPRRSSRARTNPNPAAQAGARKLPADDRTNPSQAAGPVLTAQAGASQRSAAGSRTNPSAAASGGSSKRPAQVRTNPKSPAQAPTARAGASKRSAAGSRTNPSAAARGGSSKRSAQVRTKPKSPAQAGATEPPAADQAKPKTTTARLHYDDAYIRGILQRVKTIAAVGMSANDMRPSYFAMLYLQQKGYRMIPVNPRYAGEQILGETVVASLRDLPAPPDMVQIFRKPEEAPAVVDEAIEAGAKVVWLQLGIRSDEAARRAQAAGLDVVMDRCPKIEYGRLFGEIGWAGVNRRVISAKKGQAMQLSHRRAGLARRPPPRP